MPAEAGGAGVSRRGAQRKAGARGREVQGISFRSRRGGHALRGQRVGLSRGACKERSGWEEVPWRLESADRGVWKECQVVLQTQWRLQTEHGRGAVLPGCRTFSALLQSPAEEVDPWNDPGRGVWMGGQGKGFDATGASG